MKHFEEDWEEFSPEEKILTDLKDNGFHLNRLFGSKSLYRKLNPNNFIIFNANIFIKNYGKIWFGDLDITKDAEKLIKISNDNKTTLYILSEMDGRFDNENRKDFDNVYLWNTKDGLSPVMKKYYYDNLKSK